MHSSNILLVDDHDSVRQSVSALLRKAGYQVFTAIDGSDGIEQFRLHHHHLHAVLLDVSMPKISGIDALAQLAAINNEIPILLTTGRPAEPAWSEQSTSPVTGVLEKPYRAEQLFDMLASALGPE